MLVLLAHSGFVPTVSDGCVFFGSAATKLSLSFSRVGSPSTMATEPDDEPSPNPDGEPSPDAATLARAGELWAAAKSRRVSAAAALKAEVDAEPGLGLGLGLGVGSSRRELARGAFYIAWAYATGTSISRVLDFPPASFKAVAKEIYLEAQAGESGESSHTQPCEPGGIQPPSFPARSRGTVSSTFIPKGWAFEFR